MTDNRALPSYEELATEFQTFVKNNLLDSFPSIVKFCMQDILRVMHSHRGDDKTVLRETKTETLKQKKALLSVMDMMDGRDSFRPVNKFLESAVAKLSEIAESIDAEIFTTGDFAEKPIFSLEK